MTINNGDEEEDESVRRISRDLLQAARLMGRGEVRYIVDGYYQMQEYRKASANQARQAQAQEEPATLLSYLVSQAETVEGQIRRAMQAWAEEQRPARWAMDQKGIGPVLACGLLANFDITRAPTVGHFWSFAGLNPNVKWFGREAAAKLVGAVMSEEEHEEGTFSEEETKLLDDIFAMDNRPELSQRQLQRISELSGRSFTTLLKNARDAGGVTEKGMVTYLCKRPYNANLKTLCWRVGDSFVKQSGRDDAVYGQAYRERKAIEIMENERGDNAEEAANVLATRARLSPDQRAHYEQGKLPPGRIDLRARRWAVKLFLAHLHHVMFVCHYGIEPPKPYVIEHMGHVHYKAPPGWPRE